MEWTYNDGGRAAAGFKGIAGDCVARAVAIATQQPYQTVYDALASGMGSQRRSRRTGRKSKASARNGVSVRRKWFKDYMTGIGWTWTPTMHIGSGCTVHLNANELPPGRLIVSVSKHYTAVIDGVIHDTFDPSERSATIYPANSLFNIPKGARRMDNGDWAYEPERCVYGYWSKA